MFIHGIQLSVITTAIIIFCKVSLYFLAGKGLWDFKVEVSEVLSCTSPCLACGP